MMYNTPQQKHSAAAQLLSNLSLLRVCLIHIIPVAAQPALMGLPRSSHQRHMSCIDLPIQTIFWCCAPQTPQCAPVQHLLTLPQLCRFHIPCVDHLFFYPPNMDPALGRTVLARNFSSVSPGVVMQVRESLCC
jgi:hypothetical protein